VTLEALDVRARTVGLTVRGAFHPDAEDMAPDRTGTIVMLGPDEPGFWDVFTASAEYQDEHPHSLDRWSRRIVGDLVAPLHAQAVFPYDGPPYAPFLRWAERCRTSWSSPVGLLVHDVAGLFISFRAALALPERLDLSQSPTTPCLTCADRPCTTACPVGALAPGQAYNVPACMAYVTSPQGAECRQGCLVRRACPVSQRFGRLQEQSAFHMRAFLGE
jgi:epoxyqueuosine reductase